MSELVLPSSGTHLESDLDSAPFIADTSLPPLGSKGATTGYPFQHHLYATYGTKPMQYKLPPAQDETELAKAALKEAKKNARKERKRQAKREQDATEATVASAHPAATSRTPPALLLENPSLETLVLSSLAPTPPLTATSSVISSQSSSSLDGRSSFASLDDPVSQAKAAVKIAKQKAKWQHSPNLRKALNEANQRSQVQGPWETALDNLPRVPSERRMPRASEAAIRKFQVPTDLQSLVDYGIPVPETDYNTSHSVAAAIVERLLAIHGRWSITFLDPSYRIFLTADKSAAISFRVQGGLTCRVAVAFGDPLCPVAALPRVIAEFRAYCRSHGWRTAFVGVTEAVVREADARRWASVEFATEQVVDPVQNPLLDGARGKRMAVACKKFARDKVLRMYNPADGVDTALEAALQDVYDDSFASKEAKKGDTTAYSTKLALFDLPRAMTYFYTVDPATPERPNGVAGLMNVGPGRYLLDPVVALPSAPRDTSDFLTLAAMSWLRRRGVRHMSFGLEPLREIGEIRGLSSRWHNDTRRINAASYDVLGFVGKKMLHDKFCPDAGRTQRLYLLLGGRSSVTQLEAAMAITRATHISVGPVVRQLVRMEQAERAGKVLDRMLAKLAIRGAVVPATSTPPLEGIASRPQDAEGTR